MFRRLYRDSKKDCCFCFGLISGWNVSGALEYDNRGRTVAEGQPVFSPGGANPAPPAMVNPTRTLYDTADRPTRITLPGKHLLPTLDMREMLEEVAGGVMPQIELKILVRHFPYQVTWQQLRVLSMEQQIK